MAHGEYGIDVANGLVLPIVAATIWTSNPLYYTTTINQARVINYHATLTVTVDLWVLQPGDVRANNFKVLDSEVMTPGAILLLDALIGDAILGGGTIDGLASAAAAIAFSATGTTRKV